MSISSKRKIDMTRLNLPPFEIKLRGTKAQPQIFDILRKKYIALTQKER